MMRYCLVLVAVLAACAATEQTEFLRSIQGMQGLTITCDTQDQLSLVQSFEDHEEFDFLRITKVLGEEIRVLVTADALPRFKTVLRSHGIHHETFVDNVAEKLQDDYLVNEHARTAQRAQSSSMIPLKFYPRYDEIVAHMWDLVRDYTDYSINKTATMLRIGFTYEKRPIYAMYISTNKNGNNPAVLIDAGIHAREWIATSSALWTMHQLLANESNSDLIANVDWYIIPTLNPDGYEFTHTKFQNRLWRKTRSENPGSKCYGTDLNKNFALEWMTVGASNDPCNDFYAGNKPFSQTEAATLRDFILIKHRELKLYLTLHSFGQYLVHPWGYTSDLPDNDSILESLAIKANIALNKVNGRSYVIGTSYNLMYPAAGNSADWAMGVGGIPLVYTMELPAGGSLLFNPPPREIGPIGAETFEAVKVFGRYVEKVYA